MCSSHTHGNIHLPPLHRPAIHHLNPHINQLFILDILFHQRFKYYSTTLPSAWQSVSTTIATKQYSFSTQAFYLQFFRTNLTKDPISFRHNLIKYRLYPYHNLSTDIRIIKSSLPTATTTSSPLLLQLHQ